MRDENLSVSKLVLMPALITLAVTVLRLVGELNHWNPSLFNRGAGGGGALIGERAAPAIGYNLLSVAVMVAGIFVFFFGVQRAMRPMIWVGFAIVGASLWVMRRAWPTYWKVMMAYALWARVPVIVVMFLAIQGNWGTHYDVAPPSGDIWGTNWFLKWFEIGFIPQLFLWIPDTVVLCGLLGVIVAAVRRRTRPAVAPA